MLSAGSDLEPLDAGWEHFFEQCGLSQVYHFVSVGEAVFHLCTVGPGHRNVTFSRAHIALKKSTFKR